MPLALSTEELDLLLSLAAPIDQRQRDQFLREVGRDRGGGGANRHCPGVVHRVARGVQRRFFVPPELPNASPRFRSAG